MESIMNLRENREAVVEAARAAPARAASAAAGAFGKSADFLRAVVSTKALSVIAASTVVSIVLIIIAMWLWRKLKSSYVNQASYSVQVTREGVIINKSINCLDAPKLPNMAANGQRATYTFWVYIHNLNSDGQYRYVFRRGGSENDVGVGASVLAFLDKDVPNKLHFRITKKGTQVVPGATPTAANPSLVSTSNIFKLERGAKFKERYTIEDEIRGYRGDFYTNGNQGDMTKWVNNAAVTSAMKTPLGITIPYLPIQRWVHVAVVVNEQINGGTITAYVDAEQVAQIKNAGTEFQLATANGLFLGGNAGTGVDGLLSYLTFHNYDLNTADIYKEYRAGPIRSLMAKFGLPAYGVRSPIYSLSMSK